MEGEVVDPYVVVKIVGHPADAQKMKTDIVRNNGEAWLAWVTGCGSQRLFGPWGLCTAQLVTGTLASRCPQLKGGCSGRWLMAPQEGAHYSEISLDSPLPYPYPNPDQESWLIILWIFKHVVSLAG
jgi:hypothetical protein